MTTKRYVATFVNKDNMRTLMRPAQGRFTYTTRQEVESWIDAVTNVNSKKTIESVFGKNPQFEVREVECYDGHNDPKTIWFD